MDAAVTAACASPHPASHRRGVARSIGAGVRRCFSTPLNALVSLTVLGLLIPVTIQVLRELVFNAVFLADSPAECLAARGACWATVVQHAGVLFFGLYPREELWRPAVALALAGAATVAALLPVMQRGPVLAGLAAAYWAVLHLLLGGGTLGLASIPVEQWGGLPLSLYAFLGSVLVGFPLAIGFALCRASHLPIVRWAAGAVIETVRAVPLLTVLFCAAVVAPIALPTILAPTKTTRIVLGLALFYAAYQSEVIRAGMDAVPRSEREAATALGLRPWQATWLVILPQALRLTIPATVNLLVVAFKDTSLIVVVGLFDFLAAANTTMESNAWAPFFTEIYAVVAVTYLVATGCISRFGRIAERRLAVIR